MRNSALPPLLFFLTCVLFSLTLITPLSPQGRHMPHPSACSVTYQALPFSIIFHWLLLSSVNIFPTLLLSFLCVIPHHWPLITCYHPQYHHTSTKWWRWHSQALFLFWCCLEKHEPYFNCQLKISGFILDLLIGKALFLYPTSKKLKGDF